MHSTYRGTGAVSRRSAASAPHGHVRRVTTGVRAVAVAAAIVAAWLAVPGGAAAQSLTGVNGSSDTRQLYGRCAPGASLNSRENIIFGIGESTNNQLAATIIECSGASGSLGARRAPCPAGMPYFNSCIQSDNDGQGNAVLIGLLRHDAKSTPNLNYTGCRPGAALRDKSLVAKEAGEEPRFITGIVTLSCDPATGARETPRRVACPTTPHPFDYCLGTDNDGSGNAVRLGVVLGSGAGDLYGLYGECHAGAKPGFAAKKTLLRPVGLPFVPITSLVVLACGDASTGFPASLTIVPCTAITGKPAFFDRCIWGKDARDNYVAVGLSNSAAVP
jgi:hypothetical protein